MEFLDIIIFAAIAAFLVMRLWTVLGRKNEDEKQRPNPFATPDPRSHDEGDVMVMPDRVKLPLSSAVTAFGHAAASLAGGLDQIKTADSSFDEKKFLQGAKAAFSMIVSAFAKGDLAHVERLLAPDVAQQFSSAVAKRIAAGHSLESKIDNITEAEVIAAQMDGEKAKLTVNFVSNQTNVTRDAKGNIVSGSPDQLEEIQDTWVFARDMSSNDPNWQVLETK